MDELSLNILDVANNSIAADAKLITVSVEIETKQNSLKIVISDDGKGMDDAFLQKIDDPFTTSRTTRKVGLGIPLFKMSAIMSGGEFSITSKKGKGTTVNATFQLDHIDRVPLGDIASTIITLVNGAENADILFEYSLDSQRYIFDTREVKFALGEDNLNDITILNYLKEMIQENLNLINGGFVI